MEVGRAPDSSAFVRYLTAKRAVDDRSLNRHVIDALRAHVPAGEPGRPLRVLEIGAGNGTMAARAIEWELVRHADYVAVDGDAAAVDDGWRWLPGWAQSRGLGCSPDGSGALRVRGDGRDVAIRLVHADVFDFDSGEPRCDLLIANAFLDMVEVPAILPRLWSWVRPGGHFWFTINFDGETIFVPDEEPELERRIMALYHRSMDERVVGGRPSGDSRTGRHLFTHLTGSGAEIIAAGSSDWVVHPIGGAYPGEEALFLSTILDFVEGTLGGHPELDRAHLRAWTEARRRQIAEARLTYIAHQIDFFGRVPGGPALAAEEG
jgi:SAM-dependent methyltransferase